MTMFSNLPKDGLIQPGVHALFFDSGAHRAMVQKDRTLMKESADNSVWRGFGMGMEMGRNGERRSCNTATIKNFQVSE